MNLVKESALDASAIHLSRETSHTMDLFVSRETLSGTFLISTLHLALYGATYLTYPSGSDVFIV